MRLRRWLPILAVWIAGAWYTGERLDRGWIPWDEGTLGQAAERVLAGELPHRDFDDVYTGGLAQLDAVAFRVLGTRLTSLRLVMFAAFLLWIPVVYYIARRFVEPLIAAGVTALCVVWSIPTYPAAMPSLYNLFLATAGTAAVLRFTETRQRRWLLAAGVAGGLSLLIKVVGVYYIVGVVLALVYDEHRTAMASGSPFVGHGGRPYGALLAGSSVLFTAGLLVLARPVPGGSSLVHFVLPGAVLVGLLTALEWRTPSKEPLGTRMLRFAGLLWPFAIGVALPVAVFLFPYVESHSIAALARDVFVAPTKRYRYELLAPPPLVTLGASAAWLLLLISPPSKHARMIFGALVVALAALAIAAARGGASYAGVWLVVCYVAPFAVVAGCVVLWKSQGFSLRQEQLWLLLCMTAMCSLVQIPYAQHVYIFYFAPIAILALVAIVAVRTPSVGALLIGIFFLVYGVTAVNPGRFRLWDGHRLPAEILPSVPLQIPRTGLIVGAEEAARYEKVVGLLHAHSREGSFIYAGPDSPELYYLAQRRNPTRVLYDFFDDPAQHDSVVIRVIDSLGVTVVALNREPLFSAWMDSTLATALRVRFTESASVGNFVVRWRPGA